MSKIRGVSELVGTLDSAGRAALLSALIKAEEKKGNVDKVIEETTPEKMEEIVKAAKREYYRQWRMNHREACRKHDREYWQRKGAEMVLAKEARDKADEARISNKA
jgi:hypothetical protein